MLPITQDEETVVVLVQLVNSSDRLSLHAKLGNRFQTIHWGGASTLRHATDGRPLHWLNYCLGNVLINKTN